MRATVFFRDGHTEEVVYSNYFLAFPVGIHHTDDLYFDTPSGHYKFLQNSECEEVYIKGGCSKHLLPKIVSAFYKYYNERREWFVDESIDRIEFYTE